jgi:hypothetical protein
VTNRPTPTLGQALQVFPAAHGGQLVIRLPSHIYLVGGERDLPDALLISRLTGGSGPQVVPSKTQKVPCQ